MSLCASVNFSVGILGTGQRSPLRLPTEALAMFCADLGCEAIALLQP
jgi:hypothetical protein